MQTDFVKMTMPELLTAYKQAVKDNADYRWIKGRDSEGYTLTIKHIEEELMRRCRK